MIVAAVVAALGLLLLMSLFCRAKNLSPPTMRDSVVQFYNMKSLIVGCWNDLTSTHKLPLLLKFEESYENHPKLRDPCPSKFPKSSWVRSAMY